MPARVAKEPRVFISHAWEDKVVARLIEEGLQRAGAKVWVDHTEVRGGDRISKRVSDALAWCNSLVLLWSRHAQSSKWVELEWNAAVAQHKRVIPCRLDRTQIPAIFAGTMSLEFSHFESGIESLLSVFGLVPSSTAQDPVATTRDAYRLAATRHRLAVGLACLATTVSLVLQALAVRATFGPWYADSVLYLSTVALTASVLPASLLAIRSLMAGLVVDSAPLVGVLMNLYWIALGVLLLTGVNIVSDMDSYSIWVVSVWVFAGVVTSSLFVTAVTNEAQ